MRPARLLALAVLAAACSSTAPAQPDAGLPGPADAGGTADDGAAPGDAVDPRQPLRDRSIFANGGFETVAADGTAAHWGCQYYGAGPAPAPLCAVVTGASVEGARALRVGPGVAVWQDAAGYAQDGYLRFDLFARRATGVSAGDFYAFGMTGGTSDAWQLLAKTIDDAGDGWSYTRSFTAPLAGTASVRMVIYNSSAAADLVVDDLVGVVEPQALAVPGHLLRATHHGAFGCTAGAAESAVWVPLPLHHGVQAPLHVELTVDPPEAVTSITYTLDELGNLGARLTVAPGAVFDSATVHWDGVVLTREATPAELGTLYAAATDPTPWIAPTAIVEADDPGIVASVTPLVAGLTEPADQLAAILGWTSTYVTNQGTLTALDASAVFATRNASCTGYANLAAAAGRVAGLPARSMANYLVGLPQQTHYIDEVWLGPDLGWRLVEPQGTALALPADYAILIRQDRPDDEGADALGGLGGWAMPGVPARSLVQALDATGRCFPAWPATPAFPDCAACDNTAAYQAPLTGDRAPVIAAFDRAGVLWERTLGRLTTTGPDPAEVALRRGFMDARDLAAVEALLDALDAAP